MGIQFECNNNYRSKIYGRIDADTSFEEENICSDSGYMLTWMRFRTDVNLHDCSTVRDGEDYVCIQSPAEPLQKKIVENGIKLRNWSTTCAFYPRMSKFIANTVSFELVHFPGHYLVASKASLKCVCNGTTKNLPIASLNDPHLTIERLESQQMLSICRHHQHSDQPSFSDKKPSIPLCDETYRRASFTLTDLTDGSGVEATGGDSGDDIFASELDDIAETGGADDDLGDAADEIKRVLNMWRTRGVLLMDEVDLLLHPLKSELNFPIGNKIEIDIDVETLGASGVTGSMSTINQKVTNMPKGLRWDLPIAMIDSILEADAIMNGKKVLQENEMSSHYVVELIKTFKKGKKNKVIQTIPHLILLPDNGDKNNAKSISQEIQELSSIFLIGWIETRQLIRWKHASYVGRIQSKDILEYLCYPEGKN
jgi:hypothetical protein